MQTMISFCSELVFGDLMPLSRPGPTTNQAATAGGHDFADSYRSPLSLIHI